MPVPNTIADLSQTAASNYPLGTDTVGPNLDDYLRAGFAFDRQLFDGTPWLLGNVAGTPDAITATSSVPFTAYVLGQSFRFIPTASNTTNAVTININGIGTRNITKIGNQPLAPGDLAAGVAAVLLYDGTQHQLLTATATAAATQDSRVKRLYAQNNSGTPTTKMDMVAQSVTFKGSATAPSVTKFGVGTITNDIAVAGPTVNGRDQAAAFATLSEVHFYFIWNGSTVASVSSLSPPPTGPTLPASFTHWAYAFSVKTNAITNLPQVRVLGRRVSYVTAQSIGTPNGSASFTYSIFVPTIAESFSWTGSLSLFADGAGNAYASLGVDSGITSQRVIEIGLSGLGVGGTTGPFYARWVDMPNMPAQIFSVVIAVAAGGGGTATAQFVTDYVVPNY